MGFWGDVYDTVSRSRRRKEERGEGEPIFDDPTAGVEKMKGGWIFKVLTYIAIIGLFVDIAIVVAVLINHSLTSDILMWIAIIAVICIGCLQSLTWIKLLILKKNKALSIVNLCFVAVNVIMWVISIVLIIHAYQQIRDGAEAADLKTSIDFVRAALFITIQLCIANSIMSTIIRVKKRWIPFQIIMYISQLYIDFYVSFVIFSFGINSSGFYFNSGLYFVARPWAWTIALIALIYIMISNSILNGNRRHRRRGLLQSAGIAEDIDEQNEREQRIRVEKQVEEEENSPQKRLAKLKELLDQGLITEEEYKAKKDQIISEM